ncbi:MAG: VWA domain-containing protein [Chlorobi bacterium]|nr:VWA domain-containing protein [Chlorobiota bacterium]
MIRFAHPEYLYLLLAVPLLAAGVWYAFSRRWSDMRRMGSVGTLLRLVDGYSRLKPWYKAGLFLLALSFLVVAYADPQVGTKYEEVTRKGIDLIIALDVSNSMLARDVDPNRLESAKREVISLIRQLKGDRIGIVVFAGDAYTQLPLTTDYSAALMLTDIINVHLVPRQGTAIASAIRKAMDSFGTDEGHNKALIIITDGENHEEDPVPVAEEAAKKGIVIHAIGMGTEEGTPIPIMRNGKVVGYRKNAQGETILTRLDEKTLRDIVAAAGGKYVRATNSRNELRIIFNEIEKMEKKEFGTKQFTDFENRFQYPLAFALLLLVGELLTSEKRNKWLSRFALFGGDKTDGGTL